MPCDIPSHCTHGPHTPLGRPHSTVLRKPGAASSFAPFKYHAILSRRFDPRVSRPLLDHDPKVLEGLLLMSQLKCVHLLILIPPSMLNAD